MQINFVILKTLLIRSVCFIFASRALHTQYYVSSAPAVQFSVKWIHPRLESVSAEIMRGASCCFPQDVMQRNKTNVQPRTVLLNSYIFDWLGAEHEAWIYWPEATNSVGNTESHVDPSRHVSCTFIYRLLFKTEIFHGWNRQGYKISLIKVVRWHTTQYPIQRFVKYKWNQTANIWKQSVFTDNSFTKCSQAHVVTGQRDLMAWRMNSAIPFLVTFMWHLLS